MLGVDTMEFRWVVVWMLGVDPIWRIMLVGGVEVRWVL